MIKVLIVDDSATIRQLLRNILQADDELVVVGEAGDPFEAREQIKRLRPDVLTLDVEMPKMDGITFLRNLMRLRPMPVVMISSITERGAPATLDALALGAVDYLTKPQADAWHDIGDYAALIRHKVKAASRANLAAVDLVQAAPPADAITAPRFAPGCVLAFGSSTGGTEALRLILSALPAHMPPIFIVQHIPANFSHTFAQRLDRESRLRVVEAKDAMSVEPGVAYVAPGHAHMGVVSQGTGLRIRLSEEDLIQGHRPAVDYLFHRLAALPRHQVVAALLTGMGRDGADGLRALAQAGAYTFVQDEASSIVWGMPGAALKLYEGHTVVNLREMAKRTASACHIK